MIKKIGIILLWLCSTQFYGQNNYYFSSSSGDDTNIGSEAFPFQTISKLNGLVLAPGDKVLFKRGDTFVGQIIVSYSGVEGAPIIYDSYGTGDLPVLSASDGSNGVADPTSTIRIIGKQYLEFHNLQIENERFDSTGADDDKSFGIYIQSFKSLPGSGDFEDATLFKHYRFSNLRLQNIYSVSTAGIPFDQLRSTGIYFLDAFTNDVIIEDCYFTDIERVGVWIRKYVSDVIIRNNQFIDLGGSGTIISSSKRILYEKNLMRFSGSNSDSRMIGRGSGMWVFGSDDLVAQYNISQHARGDGDSSGMHVDYGNTNILYQYNYSEDSAGGFCETLGNNNNVIWRYNISVNDGTIDKGGKNRLLWVSDFAFVPEKSQNVYIYNNTIYQGTDYKNVVGDSEISLKAASLNFINNIIYLEPTAKLGEKAYLFDVDTPNFSKNLMYGGTIKTDFKNLDASKIEQDPMFYDKGRRHFSGYKLITSSPAIGAALNFAEPTFPLAGVGIFQNITSNATEDIFGNPVDLSAPTNLGAYNGIALPSGPSVTTYEAEDGIIVGGAIINCPSAPSTQAVNVLADGKSLSFNNVNASSSDLYLINVFYANPFLSNLKMTVNGGETETFLLPYTDAYCFESGHPTAFPIIKSLNSGTNTITFEKGAIDRIEVMSVDEAVLSIGDLQAMNDVKVHLNKTIATSHETIKLNIDTKLDFMNTKVYIYDITGALIFQQKSNTEDVNIKTNNLGKGVKIVVAKIGDYLFVDKIIVR